MKKTQLITFLKQIIISYRLPIIIPFFSLLTVIGVATISTFTIAASRVATEGLFNSFNVWDAPHYLLLATQGYEPLFTGLFPLYPFLVHIVYDLHIPAVLAGEIVSLLCAILANIFLFVLVHLDFSKRIATRTVLFQFIFPTAFFFFAPYTESLFLFLTVVVFYAMRKKYYFIAFACSALACATRLPGLALIPALLVELFYYHRDSIKQRPYLVIFAVIMPSLGFISYLVINYFVTGNFLYFSYINRAHWFVSFDPTGAGLKGAYNSIFWRPQTETLLLGYAQLAAFFLALLGVIYAFFKLRLSYAVYAATSLFLLYSTSFWLSMPRYVMVLFPIIIMLAKFGEYKLFQYIWLLFSFGVFLYFTYLVLQYGPVF